MTQVQSPVLHLGNFVVPMIQPNFLSAYYVTHSRTHLAHDISLIPHNYLKNKCYYPHLRGKQVGTQRGKITCQDLTEWQN